MKIILFHAGNCGLCAPALPLSGPWPGEFSRHQLVSDILAVNGNDAERAAVLVGLAPRFRIAALERDRSAGKDLIQLGLGHAA